MVGQKISAATKIQARFRGYKVRSVIIHLGPNKVIVFGMRSEYEGASSSELEAPRRRSLRSLGSEWEPATLRSHRPRRAGSATLKHPNQRRYR